MVLEGYHQTNTSLKIKNDQLCEEMNDRILPYDVVYSLQPFKFLQHMTTFSNLNCISKCAISKHVAFDRE